MNRRILVLSFGLLGSLAAAAWMIQSKTTPNKPLAAKEPAPLTPSTESSAAGSSSGPVAGEEKAGLPPEANPAPEERVGDRSSFAAKNSSGAKESVSAGQSSVKKGPAQTAGVFTRVEYVDSQGVPIGMNARELEELGEPSPGPYSPREVEEFVQKMMATGKYKSVKDEQLKPMLDGGEMALVIKVDPLYLLNYKQSKVLDLLDIYADYKGVNLIRDSAITSASELTITSNWPLTKEEAIKLFETTFLLNGFYLIAAGDHTVKVLPNTKDPKQEGIALVRSLDDLIGGEVISSFVLKLKWIDPESATKILTESFGNLHTYGRIVPVPSVGELVITENSELIRRMKDLLDVVDRPPEEVKRTFVKLSQANADRVSELIMKILESRQKAAQGGMAAAAGGGSPPAAPAAQANLQTRPLPGATAPETAAGSGGGSANIMSSEKDLVSGQVQLIPDIRTNRILVVGSPRNVDYIERLIAEFDIVVELSEPYEQPLNYVAASDMLPILSDLLMEEEGDGGVAGGAGDGAAPTRTNTGGLGTGVTGGDGAAGGIGGVSGAGRLGSLSEPGEQQAAQSVIVGKTRLIADNRANSILVIGQPEARKKVKAILDKLDKRPLQVYLATVIGQLQVNNDDEFAVNILQKYIGSSRTGAAAVSGGKPFISGTTTVYGTDVNGNPTRQTQDGITPTSPAAATLGQMAQVAVGALPGMQIATFILGSIDLYINALTATSRFRIASRPSVFTANNKKAVIYNGKKIAVPTSTVTTLGAGGSATTTAGSQQSNIQYQDVVLKIEVVPLINSAREVSLQIIQTNDTISQNSTNIGGGVSVPEINTQELTTTVTVPDQSTILLGGLITQQDAKDVAGVPFISSIPLMGNLFKSTSDTTQRQELVVMIQPSVVQDVPEMREISKTERDLTGFSSKELSPISMKMGTKASAPDMALPSSPESLPEPPAPE